MPAVLTRAERQAATRRELIAAADRLFVRQGFHATSLDAIAAEAGVTKGAVYSNFDGKEDLFYAVYEQRVDAAVAEAEALFAMGVEHAVDRMVGAASERRGRAEADGWLAVFFEFWAHVLRHPEHRARFAELHARVPAVGVPALERYAAERGIELPEQARRLTTAWHAMQIGLSLEELTQPDVVDRGLRLRMARRQVQDLERGGTAG